MARPRLNRKVSARPRANVFAPRDLPGDDLQEILLPLEGLEALRLADLESLTATEAATRMGVSRHTFGRILGEARRQSAKALVWGMALRIVEDDSHVREPQEGRTTPVPAGGPRIAISAGAPGLDGPMEPRFGRASGFVILDPVSLSCTWIDNGSSQAMAHGAGIQAAEMVAEAGVGVLLTGLVGSKAFEALRRAGVQVGLGVEAVSVRQALERYLSGNVPMANGPNK